MRLVAHQVRRSIIHNINDEPNLILGKDARMFECPIYRKPARTELNYIGSIDFESDIGPRHWVMRGVALLCDIK